jgi:hypothetical protein
MLQPYQRAALIPNEPGVTWAHFLSTRFVQSDGSFALVMQGIVQKSQAHCDLVGLIEISSGGSLPVIFTFQGVLNLESREISIHQAQPEKAWSGQISTNGRVITLFAAGQAKPIHLVHEQTLEQLI